ncbi:MAG: hypothetical protein ABI220_02375 [Candidatus Saccharimonadales bacterium]
MNKIHHNSYPEGKAPDSNPEVCCADINGSTMNELHMRLLGHKIDALTVDGTRLIGVVDVSQGTDNEIHVVAEAENGKKHLFTYGPSEQDAVQHYLVPEE